MRFAKCLEEGGTLNTATELLLSFGSLPQLKLSFALFALKRQFTSVCFWPYSVISLWLFLSLLSHDVDFDPQVEDT